MMLPVGTRISILISGRFGSTPTHEVVVHDRKYLMICPIDKLSEITPGQQTVPVSRITEDRVRAASDPDEVADELADWLAHGVKLGLVHDLPAEIEAAGQAHGVTDETLVDRLRDRGVTVEPGESKARGLADRVVELECLITEAASAEAGDRIDAGSWTMVSAVATALLEGKIVEALEMLVTVQTMIGEELVGLELS